MEKIYSKSSPDLLLHMVHRADEIKALQRSNGLARTNVCPDEEFIQMAALNMEKGHTFKPHKHIYKSGENEAIAQESWVVIQGSLKVIMYDIDDSVIATPVLNVGDCSITFRGGHNYLIMEDDTIVYEYKTGPYKGIENDKQFLE